MSLLDENGCIPAGRICPFRNQCDPQYNFCNHGGYDHTVPFSCAMARAYDMQTAFQTPEAELFRLLSRFVGIEHRVDLRRSGHIYSYSIDPPIALKSKDLQAELDKVVSGRKYEVYSTAGNVEQAYSDDDGTLIVQKFMVNAVFIKLHADPAA